MNSKLVLRECPFCGGQAFLRIRCAGYRTNPTTILDSWEVECENKCCRTPGFRDEIFHDGSGVIIINHNGAEEAVEAWNRRAGEEDKHENYT